MTKRFPDKFVDFVTRTKIMAAAFSGNTQSNPASNIIKHLLFQPITDN